MKKDSSDYLQWVERCVAELRESGRYGQSINYRKAGRSFARFLEENRRGRPSIREITSVLIGRYNLWLSETGMVNNSISFYNRQLRAMYNLAVKKGLTKDRRPFADVYTGVAKTSKRAVSLKEITRICSVLDSGTAIARDMFEFSFSTCGMTFADMAYLRKSDIRGRTLIYSRRKTGAQVQVPLSERSRRIIRKYSAATRESPYVFPIIGEEKGEGAYRKYLSALTSYNRALKEMASKANTRTHLTSYVARHTWATAARDTGAPISVISSALGHSSERTTLIYLDGVDSSKIAIVNRKISREMLLLMTKNGSFEEPFFMTQR